MSSKTTSYIALLIGLSIGGCLGWPLMFQDEDSRRDRDDRESSDAGDEAESDAESDSLLREYRCTSETLSFQAGFGSYDSAVDIELREIYPDISYPSNQTLRAYLPVDSTSQTETQVLIRFGDIFGREAGQIPPDAEMTRASLTVWGTNSMNGNIFVHRVLRDWHAEDSWNDLFAGVSIDNLEALGMADARVSAQYTAGQYYSFDVLPSLLAWQSDPPSNFGWVFVSDNTNGFEFAGSEYITPSLRPLLEVELCSDNAPFVGFNAPADRTEEVSSEPTLEVTVRDPGKDPLEATFYGREQKAEKWTLIALPDTQVYTMTPDYNEIFMSQTQWIVDNREALNIQMVVHEGDIVQDPMVQEQWDIAHAALRLLTDNDIPFAPVPGNHDHAGWQREGDTALYSATFPASDFEYFPWWEESSDFNGNNNNYITLTIGSDDYLFVGLDFCPFPDEVDWANEVLYAHPDHKAILTTHSYIRDTDGAYTGTSCPDTSYMFDDLVDRHDNLQIVLCGHMHAGDGEYYRPDYNSNDKLVHQLVADYQARENGGNGRLRIMTFDPNTDTVYVQTYSPYTGYYETDADSEFSFSYEMKGGAPFWALGAPIDVESGGQAKVEWPGLSSDTTYEWYVVVKGARETTVSPVWRFTTAAR